MTGETNIQEDNKGSLLRSVHVYSVIDFFIDLIKRKWWLLMAVGFIAGLAGFYYAYRQPVRFESRLTFALDEGGSGSSGGGIYSLASQFGLSLGNSNDVFGGDNIMSIIKSRRIIEKTLLSVDTFGNTPRTLISYFLEKKGPGSGSEVKVEFPPSQSSELSRAQDSVLFRIYQEFESDYITVWKPDKYLNVYEVKVLSVDEDFAKEFTNRLVNETNLFYTDMRSKKGLETLRILEQRVAEMKGSLNSSITNKAAVQDANLNPAFSIALAPAMRSQANIETYGAAYAEMFKNLEVARYQYLKQIPLMQIIDPAHYPMNKIKTGKVKTAFIFSILAVSFCVLIFWFRRIIKK